MSGEDIKELLAKGDKLRHEGALDESKLHEAISYYDKVLQISPNYIPALKGKADCLGSLRRFEEAEEILKKCLAIDSNDYEVYRLKATIIIEKTGDKEEAKEEVLKGIRVLDQLLATNPDSSNLWYGKAHMLWTIDRHNEALSSLDQAIKINPKRAEYWLQKGVILKDPEVRRYEDALKAYNAGLKVAPQDGLLWTHKTGLLLFLKRYKEALRCAEKEISLQPNLPRGWRHKANTLQMLKRHKEAVECYKKALELSFRKDYAAYYEIGWCYLEMGNFDSTIKYAEEYAETLQWKKREDPMYKAFPEPERFLRVLSRPYYLLACAYAGKNDDNKAIEYLKKAVELNPQLKNLAKKSKYFQGLLHKEKFKKIVGE